MSATSLDDGSVDVGGVHPVQKKHPVDLNRWLATAVVVLAIAVIALVALLLTDGEGEGSSAFADFPTGTFETTDGSSGVEFNEDGTCRHYGLGGGWQVPCTYAVNNDLYTEMTFQAPSGVQTPATYYWEFDGELLTFELWGVDLRPARQMVYTTKVFERID